MGDIEPEAKPPLDEETDPALRIRTADLPAKTLWRASFNAPPAAPFQWTPPPVESVADLLPESEILGILGYGGMGAVYKARQKTLGRMVAIKLLPPEVSSDDGYRRRFLREARLMAHLTHPRIVGIHEAGTTPDDHLYIVMEYVEGESLYDLIHQRRITPRQTGRILADVCEGLAYAHAKGVVHRDIKPGNVLVDAEGRGKLADFGIARWNDTQLHEATTGTLFGTRDYLAPELLSRHEGDHRADIYALGVMLYEMLCFELPRGHFTPPSQRAGTDRAVDRVVATAMQQEPELRYATVAEMSQALARIRWPKPGAAAVGRAALFAGALAVAAVAGGAFWEHSHRENERAARQQPIVPLESFVPGNPDPPKLPSTVVDADGWHDWLAEQGEIPKGLEKNGDGYVALTQGVGEAWFDISPPLKGQALKVTFEHIALSLRPVMRLMVRTSPDRDAFYGVVYMSRVWQLLRREPGQHEVPFQTVYKPTILPDGAIETLELRAVGEKITLLSGGVVVGHGSQSALTGGSVSLACGSGIRLLKVEWRSLEE